MQQLLRAFLSKLFQNNLILRTNVFIL